MSFFYKATARSSKEKRVMQILCFMQQDTTILSIAKAMLDDWQNDTCVGKYLKTIFE